MQEYGSGKQNSHGSEAKLDKRSVRALTEYHSVLPEGDDIFTVVSQSENSYTVDVREGRCTCPDWKHNVGPDGKCKHIRRVEYATGRCPIPAWVDTEAVDNQLGLHVESNPRVAASDGGVVLEGDSQADSDDERPEDCECGDWNQGLDLPCWPCYRDGFEEPASND